MIHLVVSYYYFKGGQTNSMYIMKLCFVTISLLSWLQLIEFQDEISCIPFHRLLEPDHNTVLNSHEQPASWLFEATSKLASYIKKDFCLLRVIPTMTFQNSQVRFYVSLIGSGEGRLTTHLLRCVLLLSTSQTASKLAI